MQCEIYTTLKHFSSSNLVLTARFHCLHLQLVKKTSALYGGELITKAIANPFNCESKVYKWNLAIKTRFQEEKCVKLHNI